MDFKSTTSSATITLRGDMESSSNASINSDTLDSNTLYNSATGNSQTTFVSFEDSDNTNDSLTSIINSRSFSRFNISPSTSSSAIELNKTATVILNGVEHNRFDQMRSSNNGVSSSIPFIEAERMDSLPTLLDEVDPKSQLANKTIFKTNNPNLSIIEINDNSIKEQDIQNSIVVIEPPSDNENDDYTNVKHKQHLQKPATDATNIASTPINSIPLHKTSPKLNALHSEGEKSSKKTETFNAKATLNTKNRNTVDVAKCISSSSQQEDSAASIGTEEQSISRERPIIVYDTLEEFEKNLPSTVTILDTPFGSRVYLVGTAHFSEESQNDVSFVIRNVRPDVVMVELCPSRIPILKLDEKTLLEEAKNINFAKIRNVIQTHGCINGIFFILLLQLSAQMAKDVGMAPGGEFRRAFEEVHKLPGCKLHLGDRPIRVTLHRALRALSFWQTIKLVWHLTANKSINIEEIEECKQRDLLEKLMQELAGEFPAFSEVFVKERDLYLCHSLQLATLPQTIVRPDGSSSARPVKVVGVVGIGHANGIAEMWGQVDPQKIPAILQIPPTSLTTRICKYTIKYGLIAITLYGAVRFFRPRWIRLK